MNNIKTFYIQTKSDEYILCTEKNIELFSFDIKRKVEKTLWIKAIWKLYLLPIQKRKEVIKNILNK